MRPSAAMTASSGGPCTSSSSILTRSHDSAVTSSERRVPRERRQICSSAASSSGLAPSNSRWAQKLGSSRSAAHRLQTSAQRTRSTSVGSRDRMVWSSAVGNASMVVASAATPCADRGGLEKMSHY